MRTRGLVGATPCIRTCRHSSKPCFEQARDRDRRRHRARVRALRASAGRLPLRERRGVGLGGPRDGGRPRPAARARPREALLRAFVRPRELDARGRAARGTRAAARPLRVVDADAPDAVRATGLPRGRRDGRRLLLRRLSRCELLPQARRPLPARDLHERRLRRVGTGWRRARRGCLLQQPDGLCREHRGRPPRLAAIAGVGAARLRPGAVGGHDGRARLDSPVRRTARGEGTSLRARPLGARRSSRLAVLAAADRTPRAPVHMSELTIGLLLGTEEDWPAAFEALVGRLGPVGGETLRTERILNEPFDLRYRPRYAVVIDRLAWWYDLPRAWLKKVSLMDDVYLLNNPFTFQAMEKHSAYCALMRLGIRVSETWLIPHKVPPANERFQPTAERYNAPFDLETIGANVGYPLFMKPFDGGQWVGVSRVGTPEELRARYDESGERMMHLQSALEDFDVFVRSLSIGAETMSMWFDPTKPMHDRYQVKHDFLSPELGEEVISISRLVNAFFRWEFNSCETIVKDGIAYPIDYANASPDVALTSLHYYFPWAITALVRWSAFCAVTRREMHLNQNSRAYFEWGDRDDLSYEEKLAKYRELADAYFQLDAYKEFCDTHLSHLDELAHEWFSSREFDDVLVQTVRSTFPPHEQEHFVAHYRGLLEAWARDQAPRPV